MTAGDAAAQPTGLATVGCGNIAGRYVDCIATRSSLRMVSAYDLVPERAEQIAAAHSLRVAASLEEVLADPEVDIVVNLTIHGSHLEVTRACLEAGKHVFSEKPLALSAADARVLADLARARGLRLGCSPFTWMGEIAQTAWKAVRDGTLGEVRLAYAEMNWGRIETWHPNPRPFYEVGPLVDVGVYPITTLTAMFGRVKAVTAVGRALLPDRTTLESHAFSVDNPDMYIAVLDFDSGVVARISCNFYVGSQNRQKGYELHGDRGSLFFSDLDNFPGRVEIADHDGAYAPQALVRDRAREGTDWAVGVGEMAAAIREDRPHRASAEHAAHVLEVMEAIDLSSADGSKVPVTSDFPRSIPLPWAE